ncbi:hypothetical protein [Algivirga pacifica]|uniref:Uncharacterized protein n=1 Tax=Algivirga pacifica TaxID=1162670 RepID=A0ABP9D3Z7_9BACT
MRTITIKDESATGELLHELQLQMEKECISIKELIEARVKAEVEAYNQKLPEYFSGLVQPRMEEEQLNATVKKRIQPVDYEKQVYVALEAFQKNGFFVLVDDLQAEQLHEEVMLQEHTVISFIKLTPLVGG